MNKPSFYHIYTGDYAPFGYQDGVDAGKQGKPKSHFGVLTRRHWFNYIWRYEESRRSYSENYDIGHADGLKIRENVYHQIGESHMSLESYDKILQGLHDSANKVKKNIEALESALEYYDRQINAMKAIGLMENYAEQLRKHQGLDIRIKKLQEFLEELLRKLLEIEQRILALKAEAERAGA